eukprot:5546633-Pleurochrysis_carterae.AAC.1
MQSGGAARVEGGVEGGVEAGVEAAVEAAVELKSSGGARSSAAKRVQSACDTCSSDGALAGARDCACGPWRRAERCESATSTADEDLSARDVGRGELQQRDGAGRPRAQRRAEDGFDELVVRFEQCRCLGHPICEARRVVNGCGEEERLLEEAEQRAERIAARRERVRGRRRHLCARARAEGLEADARGGGGTEG